MPSLVLGSARAQFTITLSAAASEPVSVEWFTKDGTALAGRDYEANSGTVVFAPGEVTKTVEVFVHGRTVETEDRVFYVRMLPPVNAILADEVGACVIHVDTTGSTPILTVVIPKGEKGERGYSAYEIALQNGFVGTEAEWLESLKPDPAEVAEEVAPLINASTMPVTAKGTETLTPPDTDTVAGVAGRVAYMPLLKKAIAPILSAGVNIVPMAAFVGDALNPAGAGFMVVAVRAGARVALDWQYLPDSAEVRIEDGQAGDIPVALDLGLIDPNDMLIKVGDKTRRLDVWLSRIYARGPVSVADFNPVADGFTDDTLAFQLAGRGAYLPAGNYLADVTQFNPDDFHGEGLIYTTAGQVIALDPNPAIEQYVQSRMVEPRFGFDGTANGGTGTDTQIYPGAQYAPQGLAYDRNPVTGEELMFISQSVAGATWGPEEYIRIVQFKLREDGQRQEVDVFTPPLRCSHAHLSCIREGGKLWMYQSTVAPLDSINLTSETGKGWSKMEWKGAGNVSADIVNYNVWGRPGSGHRYEHYGKGCVQVSQCGRYMILIGINYTGTAGGRSLFVYDRKKVEAMADPLKAEPIFAPLPLKAMNNDSVTAYQGETSDGKFVYICWGSGAVPSRKGVTVYTMTGEKVRDICFEGPAEAYTQEHFDYGHPTLGDVVAFEPEGIFLRGKEIWVTFTDYWRKDCPVVTYDGLNYVNIGSANLNNVPNVSPLQWRRTRRAATMGAWNAGTTYTMGPMSKREKVIYRLTPKLGDAREKPLISRYMEPYSVAVNPSSSSELVDVSFPHGSTWRGSAHLTVTDSYRVAFGYLFGYTWDVRDTRDGSDNEVRSWLRTLAPVGGDHLAQIGAGDGTLAGGASISLYAASSAANKGSVRVATATGIPGVDARLMVNGATKIACNETDNVSYQPFRPLNDGDQDLGLVTRRFNVGRFNKIALGVSTCTDESGIGSPEGVVTASPGSTYRNRSGGSGTTFYVKQTGSGNTGWVAK